MEVQSVGPAHAQLREEQLKLRVARMMTNCSDFVEPHLRPCWVRKFVDEAGEGLTATAA